MKFTDEYTREDVRTLTAHNRIAVCYEYFVRDKVTVTFTAPHNTPTTFAIVQRTTAIMMQINVSV